MTDALLQLRISADYTKKPGVLRDFSLQIAEGEILGLVGPSGEEKAPLPYRSSDYWLEGARASAAKSCFEGAICSKRKSGICARSAVS